MLSQSALRAVWGPACRGLMISIPLHGSGVVQVRSSVYEAVQALNSQLIRWNYRTRRADTGGFNCRPTVGGSGWSLHAYGIAIDINWLTNPYSRRLITDMPRAMVEAICAIRTNNGKQVWNWGGYWSGNKDAMHYEVVCSPRDLATGINWATVGAAKPPTKPPVNPGSPEPEPVIESEQEMNMIRCNIPGNPAHGSIYLLSGGRRIPMKTMDQANDLRWLVGICGGEYVEVTSARAWLHYMATFPEG